VVVDAGGGVGVNDDAGGAVAPHRHEDDGGAPSSETKTYNGDVGLNGVKEGLEVPQDSGGMGVGEGDGFHYGMPFVGGAGKAASLDRCIAWVGDGLVV
jgi:hypothetical protein